jgi:hypothetical protein
MQNRKILRQALLGELAKSPDEREREEKKMPFIVATYVYASSQGQRMHSARTNLHTLFPVDLGETKKAHCPFWTPNFF